MNRKLFIKIFILGIIVSLIVFLVFQINKNSKISKMIDNKEYSQLSSYLERKKSDDEKYLKYYAEAMEIYNSEDADSIKRALEYLSKVDPAYNGKYHTIIELAVNDLKRQKENLIQKEIEEEKNLNSPNKKDGLPYKGMSESMISSTVLGEPANIETCNNFESMRADRKSKRYSWYRNGAKEGTVNDLIAVATVSYYDRKIKKEVPGYISDINFYWELEKYNEE